MVRPVLPVVRHFKLLHHQYVEMSGTLSGVENVEQTMLMASSGWSKDRALYKSRVLRKDTMKIHHTGQF